MQTNQANNEADIGQKSSLNLWSLATSPFDSTNNNGQQASGTTPLFRLQDWLAFSNEKREQLNENGNLALLISGDDDWLNHLDVILAMKSVAIEFTAFTDGRGYSIAYQLCKRHQFKGEIRAYGDVFSDLFFNLARTGFQTYQTHQNSVGNLIEGHTAPFKNVYQPSADLQTTIQKQR